jgi:8-oxo-dGTP pyrophosphatase MutT (NUDIX family)
MLNADNFIKSIENYKPISADEIRFRVQFLELLEHPRAFFRDHLPGHITGSAWIIDEDRESIFMTHHAKLNRWLQPGGHADGDENIKGVALREALEETGLTSLRLIQDSIFDLDIHLIPARPDFQEHYHYDARFLFQASKKEAFTISEESHALAWIKLNDLESVTMGNKSILRMAEKTKLL